jgi:sigma-B regulation protein RsbU (phosphoserine phosphatase)
MQSEPQRIFDYGFGCGVSETHGDLVFAAALRLLDRSIRWIARSLRIEQVSLLVYTGDQYELARATAVDRSRVCAFTEKGRVAHYLKEQASPVTVLWEHDECYLDGELLSAVEADVLAVLGTRVLVGLWANDRLVGILSLGRKAGDEPLSPLDLRMLQSIATEAAFALESCRLRAALAEESTERQRLEGELEMARQVQQRLFPRRLPFAPGLDYYGAWRAARGVSGDYLDYIELPDGRLGIAIGDVSGKGFSAALLMSSLHSMVRALSLTQQYSLPRLVATINRMFFRASPDNCYATLFLARYDPKVGRLQYVNAGHEPPFILRRNGAGYRTIFLEPTGPVVGAFRGSLYREKTITLAQEDVLVAYTDGVSEVTNPSGEEWGNRRLIETVEAHCECTARKIVSQVMAEADAFAMGAPQNDDMTLWVGRVDAAEAGAVADVVEPPATKVAASAA